MVKVKFRLNVFEAQNWGQIQASHKGETDYATYYEVESFSSTEAMLFQFCFTVYGENQFQLKH